MKSFLLSDNHDTWVGMRLAGIEGVVLHEKDKVLEVLKEAVANPEIGILILTEKIVDLAHDEIMQYKIKNKKPLIVEIPDRHGTTRGTDVMASYMRESIGIHI